MVYGDWRGFYNGFYMAQVEEVKDGKRPRLELDTQLIDGILNRHHSIFIVPVKFSRARLKLLKDICKSKSLQVAEQYRYYTVCSSIRYL